MSEEYESPHAVRNPSPPPELEQKGQNIFDDSIDNTAFSKHWLFTTLMKLIQEVDKETENKEETEFGVDIDDELQNELCRLWDMAMNPDVAKFLQEFRAVEILSGVIGKSKAPRVTEICVGILGNMACDDDICITMSENKKLIQMTILLLESPDPPTLVETTRLLYTCLSNSTARNSWLAAIKQSERLHENVLFILHSSTNCDLLKNTAEFLDTVLDEDEELCLSWTSQEFVVSLLEAVKQIGYSHSDVLETFLHIFQLLSTSEKGVQALVLCSDDVLVPLLKYLMSMCEYEIVGLDGREGCLSSAISVVNVLLTSSHDAADKLTSEPDFIRCLLKILEPAFEQLHEELQDIYREPNKVAVSDGNCENGDSLKEDTFRVTVVPSSSEAVEGDEKKPDNTATDKTGDEIDRKRINTLCNVLRVCLSDFILALETDAADSDSSEPLFVPVLKYLNNSCSRQRITYMLQLLGDGDFESSVQNLKLLADKYSQTRLTGIIANYLSGVRLERSNSLIQDVT
ncbi:protein saal1-like isoform X2 [Gigantopelta aegis]|uniref:protein saal1-like isoform X2 n=1 Tax=Gigantopelta aegis TaxID=1735272 RepID=UPI001B88E588|nr:protein saal1-like isoform X2 [Gigantopelta aegis]